MQFLYDYQSNYDNKIVNKMSLTKAHKVLTKMKKDLPLLGNNKNLSSYSIRKSQINTARDLDEIISKMKENRNDQMNSFFDYYLLENDMLTLKNAIYKKNGEINMDRILSRIDMLNALKNQYQTFLTSNYGLDSLRYFEDLNEEDIKKLSDGSDYSDPSIGISFYKKEEIQKLINAISKEVNKLENERDYLNATTEIEIELSSKNVELLGL